MDLIMRIKRVASTKHGTFGVIIWKDAPFALTLERPWANNQKGKSCIPAGEYAVLRCKASPDYGFKNSSKFGDTFQVMNVPGGRSYILFHKGNLDDDTRGCILLGEQYGFLRGQPAILASGPGFKEFLGIMATKNGFDLVITEHFDD